jgi:hypothetical protein
MPKQDALAALRDIHLPAPIGWWPLAPGWYVVLMFSLLMLLAAIAVLYRQYHQGRARRQALQLLKNYEALHQKKANSQLIAAAISELLKRVALVYFPRTDVASLQGEAWLLFLNNTAKGIDFNLVKQELIEVPFKPKQQIDLGELFRLARAWVTQRSGRCLN